MFGIISSSLVACESDSVEVVCLAPGVDEISGIPATRITQLIFQNKVKAKELCISFHETINGAFETDVNAFVEYVRFLRTAFHETYNMKSDAIEKKLSVAIFPPLLNPRPQVSADIVFDYDKTETLYKELHNLGITVFCLPIDRLIPKSNYNETLERLVPLFDGFYLLKCESSDLFTKNKEFRYIINDEDEMPIEKNHFKMFEVVKVREEERHTILPTGLVRCIENPWRIL